MGISYEEAAQAQAALEDELLKDPNVVSVGVVEEFNDVAEKTGNYVVQVGIISSEIYQNSLSKGSQTIPNEYILPPVGDSKKQEEKHIRIHVVKEGQIQALNYSSLAADLPSAEDELPVNGSTDQTWKLRIRPSPCGHSVGHPTTTAGTIGLLLKYTEGPDTGNAYILSNNHVIAANNSGYVGDPITQPGQADSGRTDKDTLGYLHRWVPLETGKANYADVAVAEVCGKHDWAKYAASHISKIGNPNSFSQAAIGMPVEKTGRTTGYTQGQVLSINETIKVNYNSIGILVFKNQIRSTLMSQGGDSGSSLIDRTSKSPVGLLFAGSNSASYYNHIEHAVSLLSNKNINKHGSKNTTFEPTYPFTIIKRNYSTSSFARSKRPFFQIAPMCQKYSFSAKSKALLSATCLGAYAAEKLFSFSKDRKTEIAPVITSSPRPLTFLFNQKPGTFSSKENLFSNQLSVTEARVRKLGL